MKVSMPTPPIHAPAWIICRLSKFHEFKMEDDPNSMETCQRESRRLSGQAREGQDVLRRLAGDWCSWPQLADGWQPISTHSTWH